MIISQDKTLITRLIKKFAGKSSTEAMLSFVADNNGMLAVCGLVSRKNIENDREAMGWVDEQCYNNQVDVRDFLYVVNQILSLLQPERDGDEHYTVLNLEPGASRAEIKEAFRTLSRRYHPDTASTEEKHASDKFFEINKAYRALMNGEIEEEQSISRPQTSGGRWTTEKSRPEVTVAKKKNIMLLVALTLLMIVVSIFAARGYQKKAMISGLQRNYSAFVPPAENIENNAAQDADIQETAPAKNHILKEPTKLEEHISQDSELKTEQGQIVETKPSVMISPELSTSNKEEVKEGTQLVKRTITPVQSKVIITKKTPPAHNARKKNSQQEREY